MDDHRSARREQLRSRRRDLDLSLRRQRELHPDEVRGSLLVIDVRLRERGLAHGTPERRALAAVEEPLRPELEEDRLTERAVFVGIRVYVWSKSADIPTRTASSSSPLPIASISFRQSWMNASRSHRWSALPVFFSTVRSMLIPLRSRPNGKRTA